MPILTLQTRNWKCRSRSGRPRLTLEIITSDPTNSTGRPAIYARKQVPSQSTLAEVAVLAAEFLAECQRRLRPLVCVSHCPTHLL